MLTIDPGFARLEGRYRGEMYYFDTFEKKNKHFEVEVRFVPDQNGGGQSTKFRFNPPQYSLSVEAITITDNGTHWVEQSLSEKFNCKLRNWSEFSQLKSDWFEMERPQITANSVGLFRRKWTIRPGGQLWSEKWIKPNGKDWEFSHRMELHRIPD